MRFFLMFILMALPMAAHAQLVVRDGKSTTEQTESATRVQDDGTGPVEAVVYGTRYPASAITAIDAQGKVTSGESLPVTPAHRKTVPETSEQWPADTVPLFVASCAEMHRELDRPCQCVIQRLMQEMKHNEFLQLSKSGRIEGDERYQSARRMCIGSLPQQP